MKRSLLFIQGGGAGVHDGWDSQIVESLSRSLGSDYDVDYPRIPNEGDPSYSAWKPTLEKELAALDEGAILVGHSLGATFLIDLLAEQPLDRELGGIFLLSAP